MQEQEMIGLEWPDQVPLDDGVQVVAPEARGEPEGEDRAEVSRALRYMVDHALRFGRVNGFDDLLEHLAGYRQYRPYNALLLLLQLPAVSYVLPAYRWEQDYRRRIRPDAQPLMALVRGGPVMFVFDISQTEETADSRPLPAFDDPLRMTDLSEAVTKLEWVVENAKADGLRVSSAPLGLRYGGCIWPVKGAPEQETLVRRRPRETTMVQVRYETVVSRRLSATERLAVLAHELGHLYCGHIGTHNERWWRSRTRVNPDCQEAEADAVARIVIRSLAPDVELPRILRRSFSQSDLAELSLEMVTKAAGRILDMTEGLAPRRDPYVSKKERELREAMSSRR